MGQRDENQKCNMVRWDMTDGTQRIRTLYIRWLVFYGQPIVSLYNGQNISYNIGSRYDHKNQ